MRVVSKCVASLMLALLTLSSFSTPQANAQPTATAEFSTGALGNHSPRWLDGAYGNRYFWANPRTFEAHIQYTIEAVSDDFDPVILVADGNAIRFQARGVRGGNAAQLALPRGTAGRYTVFVTTAQEMAAGSYVFALGQGPVNPGPGPGPGPDPLRGTWVSNITGLGQSSYAFIPIGNGRYRFEQTGHGDARGTAVLTGNQLRIEAAWANGRTIETLDLSTGTGMMIINHNNGMRYTHNTTLRRQ